MDFNRKEIPVPENMILYALKYGDIRHLAHYLKYKRIFRSGHFHSKQVPKGIDICRSTFHNHINALIDLGWAEALPTGFRLVSTRKIMKHLASIHHDYKFKGIRHIQNGTISDIISELRRIVLVREHNQLDFVRTAKRLDIRFKQGREIPKYHRDFIANGQTHNTAMSIKMIGQVFRMSSTTGHRLKRRWEAEGSINVTRQEPIIWRENTTYKEFLFFKTTSEYDGRFTYHKGIIYQRQPDNIQCYV